MLGHNIPLESKHKVRTLKSSEVIRKIPTLMKMKDSTGEVMTDINGAPMKKQVMTRLRFHLGRLVLDNGDGTTITIRHSKRTVNGIDRHQVTWTANIDGIQPCPRVFLHPDTFGEFLVERVGMQMTTNILMALSELEQESTPS